MVHSSSPSPELIVHSRQPFNAEPTLSRLRADFTTAQADLYVRSHGNIPVLSEDEFRLRVDGAVTSPVELSLAELQQRFPARTVRAVMQCAGNRRADLHAMRPVSGDPWAPGAIGNADWTGVALGDVLDAAGAQTGSDMHVVMSSADDCEADGECFRYEVSIPMSKAASPEVLLAWAMNGEALTAEHGFPLRAVVPGYAGVRSPKWLMRITVQDRPSDAKPQARDYKLFPSTVTKKTVDWEAGVVINEMPLTAAICEPARSSSVPAGDIVLRGYAVATSRGITRVDVSGDGGRIWSQADLEQDTEAPWSWTLWQARLTLAAGKHELVVRAWDAAGQTQPAQADDVWNFKGYLSAAWHRVPITVMSAGRSD